MGSPIPDSSWHFSYRRHRRFFGLPKQSLGIDSDGLSPVAGQDVHGRRVSLYRWCRQQTSIEQDRWTAISRRLLVGVGIAEQFAIVPGAPGDLEPEWQSRVVEPARHDHGGHSDHIDPTGIAVWTAAQAAALWHGLVGWRHLSGGINEAVEAQPLEDFVIGVESFAARSVVVRLCQRIRFECPLDRCGLLLAIDASPRRPRDDRGKRRADHPLIFGGRVVLGWTEALQERIGSLSNIRTSVDAADEIRKAVGQDRIIKDHGRARRTQPLNSFHEGLARFRFEWSIRFPLSLRGDLRRDRRRYALEGYSGSVHDERRHPEAFALERVGLQVAGVRTFFLFC